ncbi:trigger factor [Eubacterium ramulus]|uniref:Trigger factor n=1 Tax=Eubacterium ramulus TaxID=39490 RepID=A0A844E1L0_EUBRA|nr:trigger factor [Eubacterium ramulus]MSD15438.1 trigger factor [Eubacterium ramulus]
MRLGTYKGIHMTRPNTEVTKHEVLNVLKKKQKEYAVATNIDDRSAQEGDQVILDFQGMYHGQDIPHGNGSDFALTIGAKAFLPEFDDALIGKNIGDTFDINVTFPTDYRISTMQNRSVVFHTTLKKIRLMDYQPIDDEFAKDFSEYTTLNEWENEIFSHLQARRKTSVQEKLTREVMAKIIADSDIPIDDDMKEEITQIYYDDFLDELEMNQIPLELYCKRSGHTEDEIYADKEQEAIEAIQAQSVLHAVAAAEKISITPEELAKELRAIAIEEDEDPEEFVETLEEEDVENIADQLTMDKTMAFILDSVIYDR